MLFHRYICLCVCISVILSINDVHRETFLKGSDVYANVFSVLRGIPSGTIDTNLRSCDLNRHKLRQSQIATNQETLPSQFVICRNLRSRPSRGKLIPVTLNTWSVYLGGCTLFTWIWEIEFWTIFALFVIYLWYTRCQNEPWVCVKLLWKCAPDIKDIIVVNFWRHSGHHSETLSFEPLLNCLSAQITRV